MFVVMVGVGGEGFEGVGWGDHDLMWSGWFGVNFFNQFILSCHRGTISVHHCRSTDEEIFSSKNCFHQ